MAVGNDFVIPHSWAEDFPELSEWAGSHAFWKVVHTAGFEPIITIESRVRVERVEFSRTRFFDLAAKFKIDVAADISEDFWNFVYANGSDEMAGLVSHGSVGIDADKAAAAETMLDMSTEPVPDNPSSFPPIAVRRGPVRVDDSLDLLLHDQVGVVTPVGNASSSPTRRRSDAASGVESYRSPHHPTRGPSLSSTLGEAPRCRTATYIAQRQVT